MSAPSLDIVQSECVLTLTLDRPDKLNALDRDLGVGLLNALRDAERDPQTRVVVLTGRGRAFCAGDDIDGLDAWLNSNPDNASAALDPLDGSSIYIRIMQAIIRLPKPVIAAINGFAAGAGAELASACDVRYGAKSARIGSGLVKVGQVGNGAGFASAIGWSRATEILLTGRLLDAEEALSIGFLHGLSDDDALASDVAEIAAKFARGPTRVIGLYKEMREAMVGEGFADRLRIQELYHQARTKGIADAREGARAFLEKRPPEFTGD